MDQLQPGQIRQISQPVLNVNDGYFYNEVRILQPDGQGGYIIVTDEMNRSPIQFVDYPLPTPWIDNIETWKQFELRQTTIDLAKGDDPAAAADIVDYYLGLSNIYKAMRESGDPFSGTAFDLPYYQWPGTKTPWDPAHLQPRGALASPATPGSFPNPLPMNQRPDDLPPFNAPHAAPFGLSHPSPPDPRDPLVLDLAGVGIKLSSVAQSSAYFDFTGSGSAAKAGWITQGEGLLVLNGNPNAPITVNELVGAQSGDGFADLSALDTDGDGVINASDPRFANLSVWVDANGNGQLDSGELVGLG